MKLLRFVVMVAVLAYAGWLAWPYLAPVLGGGAPAGTETLRTAADAAAPLFGVAPPWILLAAAIGLYVVAALMLGSGNSKAVVAYFLGFLADVALRLAIDGRAPADLFARSSDGSATAAATGIPGAPPEALWLVLAGLFLLGLLVAVAGRRIRRRRTAGQLAF